MNIVTIDTRLREIATAQLVEETYKATGELYALLQEAAPQPLVISVKELPVDANGFVSVCNVLSAVQNALIEALKRNRGQKAVNEFLDNIEKKLPAYAMAALDETA